MGYNIPHKNLCATNLQSWHREVDLSSRFSIKFVKLVQVCLEKFAND